MIPIDKDVPMPACDRYFGRGRNPIYPFRDMEVGDSFLCEHRRVQLALSKSGARLGRKFASRKVDGGWRVWRVA